MNLGTSSSFYSPTQIFLKEDLWAHIPFYSGKRNVIVYSVTVLFLLHVYYSICGHNTFMHAHTSVQSRILHQIKDKTWTWRKSKGETAMTTSIIVTIF